MRGYLKKNIGFRENSLFTIADGALQISRVLKFEKLIHIRASASRARLPGLDFRLSHLCRE